MAKRRKYLKRPTQSVVAVQLRLNTNGFAYQKWGARQQCKEGDWLVDNDGDIYTVDQDVFAQTYRELNRGVYVKKTPVYAEVAESDGNIATKEGVSHYRAGDYLVSNGANGEDTYCVSAAKFEATYELLD